MSTQGNRAIEYHVTQKGKLLWIAQKDDQSLLFKPSLEEAKRARDELNRVIAELEK